MKKFELSEEGCSDENRPSSERLQAFTKALWGALVPGSGRCVSVQGELVRANGRLQDEYFRNGMGNYYACDEPDEQLADTFYGELALFMLDTLVANRNDALAQEDVDYFTSVRRQLEPNWSRRLRYDALSNKAEDEELTEQERRELEDLDGQLLSPPWERLFDRAERCLANWCLTNTALVGRNGEPVTEGGVSDVLHIFEPPPAPPPCPLCNGKGWTTPRSPTDFASICSCRK